MSHAQEETFHDLNRSKMNTYKITFNADDLNPARIFFLNKVITFIFIKKNGYLHIHIECENAQNIEKIIISLSNTDQSKIVKFPVNNTSIRVPKFIECSKLKNIELQVHIEFGKRIGFENQGNTCYINVMLQALHSINGFKNAVCESERSVNTPILYELQKIFNRLQSSDTSLNTIDFTTAFDKIMAAQLKRGYTSNTQQDPHEFFHRLIEILQTKENFVQPIENIFHIVVKRDESHLTLDLKVHCMKNSKF